MNKYSTTWITCEDCLDVDGDVVPCHRHTREHYVVELSKTKAVERIRRAAKLVRSTRGYPTNWRTEIGTRLLPVYADTEFEAKTMNAVTARRGSGDDLIECMTIEEAFRYSTQPLGAGYVVHLYFSSNGEYGELEDVVTVWTGTDTIQPVIIN